MEPPVDLTNLHSMTDNDTELEKALFEEFFSSFEKGMSSMQANCSKATAGTWRSDAHALKGIALNLGAAALGNLCKIAQDKSEADEGAKQEILKNITAEYGRVEEFLKAI
jgi:HPt (histidine-containing phosphotransfer) domain-containing protein